MLKLGLLGKNITHSKSKLIYENLLNTSVDYDLFDYPTTESIPELEYFFSIVRGLSITAPYKEHFIDNVIIDKRAGLVGAINCIKFDQHKRQYFGYNTDLLACEEILNNLLVRHSGPVLVLGNGAMARVITTLLTTISVNYQQVFRNNNFQLNDFNLDNLASDNILVINCCSRGVVFRPIGDLANIKLFWDLNYGQDDIYKNCLSPKTIYMNGVELLTLQAKFALEIWGIK